MRALRIYNYKPKSALCGKRVIALGFFDGVHRGHRRILSTAKKKAEENSLPCAVFTFSGEEFLLKGGHIYSTEQKLSILSELGIDEVILADFSDVKSTSAEDFVTEILLADLGCAIAISGEDFRFGKGALGDTLLLSSVLADRGASLICPEEVTENGRKISSTAIRELLKNGKIREANAYLGAPYFMTGEVKRGLGLGKGFGFPTLNFNIDERGIDILSGVYKCVCRADGKEYRAIANIGICPTVSERNKHVEAYLLDYSGDLYGKTVRLEILDFIRPEIKFNSKEELIMQIKLDINNTFKTEEL